MKLDKKSYFLRYSPSHGPQMILIIIIIIIMMMMMMTSNNNNDNNKENLNKFNRYVNYENPVKLILSKNAGIFA